MVEPVGNGWLSFGAKDLCMKVGETLESQKFSSTKHSKEVKQKSQLKRLGKFAKGKVKMNNSLYLPELQSGQASQLIHGQEHWPVGRFCKICFKLEISTEVTGNSENPSIFELCT